MKCLDQKTKRSRLRSRYLLFRFPLVVSLLVLLHAPASAAWHIALDGTDITGIAAPIERGNLPDVNISALAVIVNVQVDVNGEDVTVLDPSGTRWFSQNNALSLATGTDGRTIDLRSPLMIMGGAAYLPIEALADIAGLQLDSNADTKHAALSTKKAARPGADDSWQSFTIEKPRDDRPRNSYAPAHVNKVQESLPPAHDNICMTVGMGYVENTDGGIAITGSGRVKGVDVNFNTLTTIGRRGLRVDYSGLSVTDRENGWGFDAGPLSSDIWGGVTGIRYRFVSGNDHWRSLSLYLDQNGQPGSSTVLTYRDEQAISPYVNIGGEISSDGSAILKTRYARGSTTLSAYGRTTSGSGEDENFSAGDGMGFFASYALSRSVQIYGGMTRTNTADDTTVWKNISCRFPIARSTDVVLEHSEYSSDDSTNTAEAVMLMLPIGPLHVLTRYQWGNNSKLLIGPDLGWGGTSYRQLMASTAYYAGDRVNFNYQISTRWQQDNTPNTFGRLVSTYKISPSTKLQVTSGFPDIAASDLLQFRLTSKIDNDFSLSLEYGQLSSYQGIANDPDNRGFKLLLNKRLDILTPARGAEIRGRVVDQAGCPVPSAAVCLGKYRTATDKDGCYRMKNIPSGTYQLYVDEKSLPADMVAASRVETVTLSHKSRREINLTVSPLGSISGIVYMDKNGNGKFDPAEGIAGVPVTCEDSATSTLENGTFLFNNLLPGNHKVQVAVSNLDARYAMDSPPQIDAALEPGKTVSGLVFKLKKVEREIILQSMR